MQLMQVLLSEIFFVIVCIIAAFIERNFFKYNHSFKHWWGLAIYTFLVAIDFLLFRNLILCLALFLIGEIVFAPFLNILRNHKFFYTDVQDPNGSWLDRTEGKMNRPIYFISLTGLIVLNIIFFK